MSVDFKSNDIKKYISKILDKNIDEISEVDLNQIKDIKLSHINFLGKETDYTLEDLDKFKNLQACTIFKFNINNKDLEILKSLSNLKYIHFDFCVFDLNGITFNNIVENICFTMCKNLKINQLKNINVKSLKIIGNRNNKIEFDINEFNIMNNLGELFIHNYDIKNIEEILKKAPNIRKINLDGSIVDTKIIESLKEKIEISNEEFFIYMQMLK